MNKQVYKVGDIVRANAQYSFDFISRGIPYSLVQIVAVHFSANRNLDNIGYDCKVIACNPRYKSSALHFPLGDECWLYFGRDLSPTDERDLKVLLPKFKIQEVDK